MMVPGIAALAGLLAFGLAGTASAFHEGGVAHCDGCHSMHNSPENPVGGTPNRTLLKGTDASSTCLNCHEGTGSPTSYHILSTDATAQSPGGDFFWLTQSYTYTNWAGEQTSDPDNTGHNVVATDFGLTVDATNATAPGGTYAAADLGCDSCHDPHGQVNGGAGDPISVSGSYGEVAPAGTIAGNYRLLGDTGYGLAAAPVATIAPTAWGGGYYGESDDHHVAYGANMSEWCASCHGDYINDSHKHPAANGEYLNGQAAIYNQYVATGDLSGIVDNSYLALVPFELQETDPTVRLTRSTSLQGPDSTNNVMCLTCHRAHASAFNNAMRWDAENELLAHSIPGAEQLVEMGAVANSAYYGRDIATEFGEYQRSLCNKCHLQD
jgi:predicted CXXCH cytochrome family protein